MFLNNTDYFDQHFLIDSQVINKFIESANLSKNDVVVEIGPGKGQITELIAPRVKKIICIELDTRLKPFLKELQKKHSNIEVIYDSVLSVEIPHCNKIITSLPYSIVEPFMHKMINTKFDELLMITGSRFAKGVRDNELSKLALMTNCYFESEYIMDIIPSSFKPEPRVVSSMIKLKHNDINAISNFNLLMFRYMFYFADKNIKNSLIESLIKIRNITQKQSKEIINSVNLDKELSEKKFETCSNEDLLKLNDIITIIDRN